MGELIPLFPLGTPLFPGVVLPLQVFEPRYRRLMHDLLAHPESGDRRFFGVAAIRYRRMGYGQQLADAGDAVPANGAGEQPVVADAMEALWQNVQQKAADEIRRLEWHRLTAHGTFAATTLVAEGDADARRVDVGLDVRDFRPIGRGAVGGAAPRTTRRLQL